MYYMSDLSQEFFGVDCSICMLLCQDWLPSPPFSCTEAGMWEVLLQVWPCLQSVLFPFVPSAGSEDLE